MKHLHVQPYVREDDPLWQALLREGKALWELFGSPRIHAALLPPKTREVSEHVYSGVEYRRGDYERSVKGGGYVKRGV